MKGIATFDWVALDAIWQEKGEVAAVIACVPLKKNRLLEEVIPGSEADRCVHCGKVPDMYRYGPYRERRSFVELLEGRVTWTPWETYELDFCKCWEPEQGYSDSLEYR